MPVRLGGSTPTIQDIVRGPAGNVWVLADGVVYRMADGSFSRSKLSDHADAIAATEFGMFFATATGLFWLDEFSGAESLSQLFEEHVNWITAGGGRLWFGSPAHKSTVFSMPLDSSGRPDSSRTAQTTVPANARIRRILTPFDSEVLAIDADYRLQFLKANGTTGNPLNIDEEEVFEGAATSKKLGYILTSKRLIAVRGEKDVTEYPLDGGTSLSLAANGGLWIIKKSKLSLFDTQKKKILREIAVPSEVSGRSAVEDSANRLWLGTDNGLYLTLLRPGQSQQLTKTQDTLTARLRSLELGPEGAPQKASRFTFSPDGKLWRVESRTVRPVNGQTGCDFKDALQSVSFVPQMFVASASGYIRRVENCVVKFEIPLPPKLDSNQLFGEVRRLDVADELLTKLQGSSRLMTSLLREAGKEKLEGMEAEDTLAAFVQKTLRSADELAELSRLISQQTTIDIVSQTDSAVLVQRTGDSEKSLFLIDKNPINGNYRVNELPNSIPASGFRTMQASADATIFALDAGGRVAEIGPDLRLHSWDLAAASIELEPGLPQFERSSRFRDWTLLPAAESRGVYVLGGNSVWEMTPRSGPAIRIQSPGKKSSSSDAKTLGLFPEQDGSIVVGCWKCDEKRNLFRVSADGVSTELPLNADKIGCGNNAIYRDSNGSVWISTVDGVFTTRDFANFDQVMDANRKPVNEHFNKLVEIPSGSGHIFGVSGNRGGLWELDAVPKQKWTNQKGLSDMAFTLSDPNPTVWVQGADTLATVSLETGTLLTDYYKDMATMLPRKKTEARRGCITCSQSGTAAY
jgi:hypothetical protein